MMESEETSGSLTELYLNIRRVQDSHTQQFDNLSQLLTQQSSNLQQLQLLTQQNAVIQQFAQQMGDLSTVTQQHSNLLASHSAMLQDISQGLKEMKIRDLNRVGATFNSGRAPTSSLQPLLSIETGRPIEFFPHTAEHFARFDDALIIRLADAIGIHQGPIVDMERLRALVKAATAGIVF